MLRLALLVLALLTVTAASAQVRSYEVQRYEILLEEGLNFSGRIRFELVQRFGGSSRTETIGVTSLQDLANWSELLRARTVLVEIDEAGRKRFYFVGAKQIP